MRRAQGTSEAGAALAETAVILPVVIVLALHAAVLTDLVRVKLRSLEAARFVAWEKTVLRPDAEVLAEARSRFGAGQPHRLGVSQPRLAVSLDARPTRPLTRAAGAGLARLSAQARLPRTGEAVAEAAFTVENRLVPVGLKGLRLAHARLGRPFRFRSRQATPYGSWRAWPGPDNRLGHADPGAAPGDTYAVAEAVTASQVEALAFVGLGRLPLLDTLLEVGRRLDLPSPLDAGPAAAGGPITLGPAEPDSAPAFSPAARTVGTTRLGDRYGPRPFTVDTPEPGVDRSRYSLPFRLATGHWWHTSGGYAHKPLPELLADYAATRACRGPFQDGAVRADVAPRQPEAWAGCDGPADPWSASGGTAGLSRLGGILAP